MGDKQFLHGDDVSLSDLMVFGVLRSIHGLTTFNEVMQNSPVLRAWYVWYTCILCVVYVCYMCVLYVCYCPSVRLSVSLPAVLF